VPKKPKQQPLPTPRLKEYEELKRAVTRYAKAAVNQSWAGVGPKEEKHELEMRAQESFLRLMNAIDSFEHAARADAIKIVLAAPDDEPLRRVLQESGVEINPVGRYDGRHREPVFIYKIENTPANIGRTAELAFAQVFARHLKLEATRNIPQPREGNACRYCDGNMHYMAETDAGPCRCAPEPGSIWQHTNGRLYEVIGLSNVNTLRAEHPIDVIYRTHALHNIPRAHCWTRRLSDWTRSFIPMPPKENTP
jgi:hypothetical protein